MSRVVVAGGGFAGVWAALSAAATRRRRAGSYAAFEIVLVSRDPYLTIRPRLYEADLADVRVPLARLLAAHDVELRIGEVSQVDANERSVTIPAETLTYDRLVLATGSRLQRPALPGGERVFSVDTYDEATVLAKHLSTVQNGTVAVIGAGFTGIEVATALAARRRVVLIEREPEIAPGLGASARAHIQRALMRLKMEARIGRAVNVIASDGVLLDNDEWIAAQTVVWTGGLRASALAGQLGVELDALGRLPADKYLRVAGVHDIYAAGDVAHAMADAQHVSPMSCQHAIPMGERAGANAALDLLGLAGVAYEQPDHVVCLDLGAAGALFLNGWPGAEEVKLVGFWGKLMKQAINRQLIYPTSQWRAAVARRHFGT